MPYFLSNSSARIGTPRLQASTPKVGNRVCHSRIASRRTTGRLLADPDELDQSSYLQGGKFHRRHLEGHALLECSFAFRRGYWHFVQAFVPNPRRCSCRACVGEKRNVRIRRAERIRRQAANEARAPHSVREVRHGVVVGRPVGRGNLRCSTISRSSGSGCYHSQCCGVPHEDPSYLFVSG